MEDGAGGPSVDGSWSSAPAGISRFGSGAPDAWPRLSTGSPGRPAAGPDVEEWIVGRSFRRDRGAEGAAAVEFALVMPILITVMFGILQYGLWFNDSLNTRQGVREAARQGVVRNFPVAAPCTSTSTDMDKLRCDAKRQINALTGAEYVKVVKPTTWSKSQPLIVCALVKSEGGVGLFPMPNNGWISSTTQMSIEQDATPLPTGATTQDALPSGAPAYPC